MSLFDKPLPPIGRVVTPSLQKGPCADCGKKDELCYQRCVKCLDVWTTQVKMANRALRK